LTGLLAGALSAGAIAGKIIRMDKCRYCGKLRDEWECHGQECRTAIAKALRRQRSGLPMLPNVIRNEVPAGASPSEVIAVLSRQRLRARRANEERRERQQAEGYEIEAQDTPTSR
jgi:hypothetical protein